METDIRHRFMNNPRVANKVVDELQESGGSPNVLKICRITHAEYEALAEKDQNTLYLFTDDAGRRSLTDLGAEDQQQTDAAISTS